MDRPAWRYQMESRARDYLQSQEFRSSVQVASGILFASLFIFVRQLSFSSYELLGVGLAVGLLRLSPDISAGARISSAAGLVFANWALVIAAVLVQVARVTHAYPTWLTIFTVLVFALLSILRVLSGTMGYLLSLIFSVAIVQGQFAWPADILWREMVWGSIRALFLSSALTIFVGCFILPTSARDAIPEALAKHCEFAGHALSAIASNLMPVNADTKSVQADSLKAHLASVLGNQALDDDVVDEALTRPSSVAEYQAKRTDPDADHKPRYVKGSGDKRVSSLFPAMLKSSRLEKVAAFEPAWLGSCCIELDQWKKVFAEMHTLALHIASLQALLQGHEAVLLEPVFVHLFGENPLPSFRKLMALVAAALAALAQDLKHMADGASKPIEGSHIAGEAQGELIGEVRNVLRRCHAAWQHRKHLPENLDRESGLLDTPLEVRALSVLQCQSLALLASAVRLEKLLKADAPHVGSYSMRGCWHSLFNGNAHQHSRKDDVEKVLKVKGTDASKSHRAGWQRAKLELQPFMTCVDVITGKPVWEACKKSYNGSFTSCFGTWQRAWNTVRHDSSFAFGLSFFVASAGSLVAVLQAAQHVPIIRKWHSYYLAVTITSTMQEHVDYAATRGVARMAATLLAGTLGYVVMLRPRLATNTYGLTAISCAWAFLMGHFWFGALKYGSYLGVVALAAEIFNQYSPIPGSHGTISFYLARVCEYAIGIGISWVIQFLFPRFLAADVMGDIGEAAQASVKLVRQYVDAYLAELQDLAANGKGADAEPSKGQASAEIFQKGSKRPKDLQDKDITSKVALPLGSVQLALAREGVVWSRGPLVLPPIAKRSIHHLQVLLENTMLTFTMVKQDAFVEGEYTAHIYHSLFQALQEQLGCQMQCMAELGGALTAALNVDSTLADLQALQAAVSSLEHQRNITRQRLRDVRHQGRIARSHQVQRPCLHDLAQPLTSSPSHPVSESSEHAIKILSGHTPDDALRGLGMLTAVGRFSDKLILFAKDVSRDAWLRKRAKRTWLARYALYY